MLEGVRRRRVVPEGSSVGIAVLDWGGEGPLALLHHANGFCAALWDPVARALARHYRVLGMDARGHGDSDRPEGAASYRWERFGGDAAGVARVLASEHPDGRIALGLGHSFGGTALLSAAAAQARLFERLVLVDPVLLRGSAPQGTARFRPRGGEFSELARKRRQVWPSREAAGEAWREKELFADWRPEVFALYLAEALRDRPDGSVELKCPGWVEATIFESGADFDAWALARAVRVPVLLQWARRGNFPRPYFEALAAEMHDARVCTADAGHLVPMERPELVVDAVLGAAAPQVPR